MKNTILMGFYKAKAEKLFANELSLSKGGELELSI